MPCALLTDGIPARQVFQMQPCDDLRATTRAAISASCAAPAAPVVIVANADMMWSPVLILPERPRALDMKSHLAEPHRRLDRKGSTGLRGRGDRLPNAVGRRAAWRWRSDVHGSSPVDSDA